MEPTGLVPHLVVKDADKAISFYQAAFGAEERTRMPSADGRILHAVLSISGHTVFLCDDFPEYHGGHSRVLPAGQMGQVTLHMGVPDTDAAMARAVAAGATVTMPAADAAWGDRYGKVRDPFGHEWSFNAPLQPGEKAGMGEAAIKTT